MSDIGTKDLEEEGISGENQVLIQNQHPGSANRVPATPGILH